MTAPDERLSPARLALLLAATANLAIALMITAPLVRSVQTGLQAVFAFVSIAGYAGILFVGLAWLLSIPAATSRGRSAALWTAPILFTLVQAALFLDVGIYKMFRFHFNGLVWQTLTAPGGWNALKVETSDLVILGLAVVLFAAGQIALVRFLDRRAGSWPLVPRLTFRHAAIAVAAFGVADRATYAAFDLTRDYEIARAARVVPGYQRFTVRRFAKTWFGWEPGSADVAFTGKRPANTGLKYPAKPLTWQPPAGRPNIVWVVLESWRHDAFGPEHSPEIWEIGQKGHVFENHISGGNNTTFGVFSMFYGLYGSYRSAFLAENRGPVLVDRLKELDYRFSVLASFPMTWPEFRKYAFVDIVDSVKDRYPHEESAKNDPLVVDDFLAFVDAGLAAEKKQPFFGFLLLDASHAPYTFPDEFGKFKPYTQDAKVVRYVDVTQRAPEMRNRYYNSVLWESHQVGRLWKALETRGLLENTIVLVTGDHGEEFNEYGFWTHSGGYSPAQTHVPAVLWWPGRGHKTVTARTAHDDIPATFLEALGVQNPPSDYSLGRSLFTVTESEPYTVACGWRDCAVVDDEGYVVFGLEGHYSMNFDVLDKAYKAVPDPRVAMETRGDRMLLVMQEMGVFLK